MNVVVENLSAGYGSALIVDDVSLEVPEHAVAAVVGRNGMGKTTLLKALMGYIRPRGGKVHIGGRNVTRWPTYRIARAGVAYAPQEKTLYGELTVAENLDVGTGRNRDPGLRAAVLERFPVLGERLGQHAGTLSGGEQKMLTLAKALVADPRLLVLDEISDGMQPSVVTAVSDVLTWMRAERGCTVLMVEQNLELSLAVADRISVLKLGRIIYDTEPGEAGVRDELVVQLAP
jgi:ABC-type branched-subunit amino acid transport system ATPase component